MIQHAKRCLAALMALCLLLSGGVISTVAADASEPVYEEVDQFLHTFDDAPEAAEFNANTTGFGSNEVHMNAQVVSGAGAIEGRSPRIQNGDMVWWGYCYGAKTMGFEMDVLFDDNYKDNIMYLTPTMRSSHYLSLRGVINVQPDENGEPALYNFDNEKIMTLPRHQTLTLTAVANYGENTYSLLVNGEPVADGNYYVDDLAFYCIYSMAFVVRSTTLDSYLTVDNIRAYTLTRPYDLPHSFQKPGKVPTVELPEIPAVEGVAVYANETMISQPAATADGTMLLPLAETLAAAGATATVHGDGSATIVTDKASFTLSADGKTLSWNDDKVTLNTPAAVVEGILYAPGQVFAETLDAKVWYAEALEMIVVSTGKYKDDNILRNIGATFWMNGQPYYEISYNKWDLQHQIYADASFCEGKYGDTIAWGTPETTLAGAEAALKELSENGFKTIRIFCDYINPNKSEEALANYWAVTDKMYDLCDQYGIRVVLCLGVLIDEFVEGQYAEDGSWVLGYEETFYDLVTDPESKSRANLNEFLKQYVTRYKDRNAVFMWEVVNEGNLRADIGSGTSATYSLQQLGNFYTDVANEIRKYDPEHMVTSGDALLRMAQWHLFTSVMKGGGQDWTMDTQKDRLKALWTINSGLDAVSVHGYGVGYDNAGGHMYYAEKKGTRVYHRLITWDFLLNEAKTIGLPLYNGECGGMMDENGKEALLPNIGAKGAEARGRYLDTIIESGVQLTHWWSFRSDHRDYGIHVWSITSDGTPESFAVIKEANEKLQAKYIVNPLEAENTHTLSTKEGDGATPYVEETTVPDVTETPTAEIPNEGGCASVLGGGLASIVMLGGLWLAFAARKKN